MIIYLDMDDVVADWQQAAQDYLKIEWRKDTERLPLPQWNSLRSYQRFYRDLPVKSGAPTLVQWCQLYVGRNSHLHEELGVAFLSAIPHQNDMPWAVQDKVFWADRYFPGIPVFIGPYSGDKHLHCRPGDILIDDRESNITSWIAAGGRGHIYTDVDLCIKWLESELGDQLGR